MLQIQYASLTLLALWCFAGAHRELIWGRSWWLGLGALIVAALGYFWARRQGQIVRLKPTPEQLKKAALAALVAAIPVWVLFVFLLKGDSEGTRFLKDFLSEAQPTSFPALLWVALIAAPSVEFVVRGGLAPAWGAGSIALLEALTVGFAVQNVLPFLILWPLGYASSHLCHRHGILVSMLARAFWTLGILLAWFALA